MTGPEVTPAVEIPYRADEVTVTFRVPCDVPLDETSRYAVGEHVANAVSWTAHVIDVQRDLPAAFAGVFG